MDSNYGHVLVRTGNRNARNDQESYMVQRYDIVWPYGQDRAPRVQQYGLVTSAPYANMIWRNEEPFVLLPSVVRTEQSAFDLDLGNQQIRLFHLEPLAIKETIEANEETKELRTAAKGSVCAKLESQLERDEQEAGESAMWEDSDDKEVVCVRVTPRTSPSTNTVSVFKFAAGLDPENKRVAVLANVDFGAEPITKVRLGKPDTPRDGWIIARSGDTDRWLGTPWRVEAWQRLACQVYQQDKGQDLPRYKTVYDLVRGSTSPTGADDGIKMNRVCPRLSSPNSSLSAKN